ncbi:SbcC/MukB-like Walker B domain-containing protein [Streptomyces sp. BE133]|uniref:SbcC/MukB-like Walker B domain-containing protein n=1 Tax=Streptomyces sp. BE133 TaxID=3002523 RepID=UPI002E761983|nr:SbcC/MukB-like Walker B domain-containing protein [Streptomyces sp. BE133]MEE1806772.1 SbcC/MukB-like Walker B domain-containing protein [Streptomyces sp. BE133]
MNAVDDIERWWRRWHLIGAGVDNVWHYTREVLTCPTGRWLARGPNGTGKTTLLELLCPFLLDPSHGHLSSTAGRTTSLLSLMKGGAAGRRRVGCVWLSFGPPGDPASGDADAGEQHYGLRLEYSQRANEVDKVPFRLPIVPGQDGSDLSTMSREDFATWVAQQGGEIFGSPADYVADLAQRVFGCGPQRLRTIARRIKKVRNPALLAGTTPADAAAELRNALPKVSESVVKAAQEALAAAEATRRRYERDAKAAHVLAELGAAWSHAVAQAGAEAVETALGRATALEDSRERAQRVAEEAQECTGALAALERQIQGLAVEEREQGAQARALAADAAHSNVAQARAEVERREMEHGKNCDILELQARAAARAAEDVEEAARSVSYLLGQVEACCARAQVQVVTASPVSVQVGQQPPLKIGERVFEPGSQLEVCVDASAAGQLRDQLLDTRRGLERRGEQAEAAAVSYQDVAVLEREGAQARRQADDAADAARQAEARHQDTWEEARDCVLSLSERVQEWARAAGDRCLTPQLDVALIGREAGGWGGEQEWAGVIHGAGRFARQVEQAAHKSGVRARSRAEHHTSLAAQAYQVAQEAAGRERRWSSGELLPLPGPGWNTGAGEERAFALAVVWKPSSAGGRDRDVAEAVMGAVGLLSAELTDLGAAGEGGWQVGPHGPALPAGQSLAAVLGPVPGHPLEEVASRVLERIAYLPSAATVAADDVTAGLIVGADGTYRAGPLTGRLPLEGAALTPASHIGAAARRAAALRAAAMAYAECERWRRTGERHARAAQSLSRFAEDVAAVADSFPREEVAHTERAEATRVEASRAAHAAQARAGQLDQAARNAQGVHRVALGRWRDSARALGLPDTLCAVEQEAKATHGRAAAVGEAADRAESISALVNRVQGAASHWTEASGRARDAAGAAQASWADVRDAHAELEACRQRGGLDETALVDAAHAARRTHEETVRQLEGARSQLPAVSARKGAAQQAVQEAEQRVREAVPAAEAAGARVRELWAFAPLREDVLTGTVLEHPGEAGDRGWLVDLLSRLRAVPAPKGPLEDCALSVRLQLAEDGEDWQFGHASAPQGLPTHQLTLAGRGMTPVAAAKQAAERQAAARAAYDSAEDQALQKFVLDQIPSAIGSAWADMQQWVKDINTQMRRARASSGVVVQLKVSLAPDLTPSRALIHELTCNVGDADRTPEQQHQVGQELLAVMRQGEDGAGPDRADRLAEAIDIRNWVTVQYMVIRPDGTTERWGAQQTNVSGGESRLIVLAPMLAALSAEYRDLPARALRLCALDEIPGEIDEKGRDGIAAYTASLDLDLMCTSHHWDGAPGAWDGIDIHDLTKSSTGIVISEPQLLYSRAFQAATGLMPSQAAPEPAGSAKGAGVTP